MPRNSRASMRTGSSKEASDTIYLRKPHKLLLRRSSTSLRPDQRHRGTARVWIPIPRRTIGPSVRIRRLLRASNKRLASTDFVEETPVVGQGPSGFCRGHGRIPSRRAFCLWDVLKAAAAAPTAAVSARAYRAPRKQRRPDSRCRITVRTSQRGMPRAQFGARSRRALSQDMSVKERNAGASAVSTSTSSREPADAPIPRVNRRCLAEIFRVALV
jgi:hypothetical protein